MLEEEKMIRVVLLVLLHPLLVWSKGRTKLPMYRSKLVVVLVAGFAAAPPPLGAGFSGALVPRLGSAARSAWPPGAPGGCWPAPPARTAARRL